VTDELPPKDPGSGILIRAGGLVVACWGAVLLAALGAFLTPFRIGSVLVPISVVLVVTGLFALTQFAYDVTGHNWLSLVPGVIWLLISFGWSSRSNEGDLVLVEQNWVASVYLLAGAITIGVTAYRIIVPPRRRGL
jgi:hypothetical protein